MFQWTDEIMAFREDAENYTRFDEAIAGRVASYLSPGSRLCDAGCGMGFLSVKLCRMGFSVTAVDESAAAVAYLRSKQTQAGLTGLTVVQGGPVYHDTGQTIRCHGLLFFRRCGAIS